jgi:hypothetical protein
MNFLAALCAWFFYLVPGIVEVLISSQAWFAPKNVFWLGATISYTVLSMWVQFGSF